MPMVEFQYHGQAIAFEADIWEPGPYKIDRHAECRLPDKKPGHYTAQRDPFEIPGVLSHGGCTSEVIATAEDKEGFFRTEVHATLNNLNVEGGALTADRITLGMISMYRRQWFDNGKPYATRVRVVPYGCSIVGLRAKGAPVEDHLPAPFHYSSDRCETYLRGDDPDAAVEAEIRQAIADSPSRFLYVKNLGRIFLGEWALLSSAHWQSIHQIYMVRMALGSRPSGLLIVGDGQCGGSADSGVLGNGEPLAVSETFTLFKHHRYSPEFGTGDAFATVRVFYGTDREPTGDTRPDHFFGAERSPELKLGSVEVSIPHDHRIGKLEGPRWWKLQFREDPAKHIVLLSLEPLPPSAFIERFRQVVQGQPAREALIFVHGYNVGFADACRRTAQIAYDLNFPGVPVTYSWPSEHEVARYPVDETNVQWSVPHFREFVSMIASECGADAVHVIAHSMGNRALVEALRTLNVNELPVGAARMTQVILAAPDIDAQTFREMVKEFKKKASRFTLYASSKDLALAASKAIHKYPRAGDSGEDLVVVAGVDTIDATAVDTGLMGHSYIGDRDSILADVYDLLRDGSPPPRRFRLQRREQAGKEYWVFKP